MVLVAAWILRSLDQVSPWIKGLGALVLAPPLVLAGYTFLRDDELEPYRGRELGLRVAACGLTCSECPAYIATRKNDDALRAETAKKWSEMFKADIKAADINCDGCTSNSPRLFNYCGVCVIRKCAGEKKVANCAYCPEYSCQKLDEFLAQVPEARKALEEIRKAAKG